MAEPLLGGVLLFPGFDVLDATGPMAVLGKTPDHLRLTTFAERAGPVVSGVQGPELVAEHGFGDCPQLDLLVVPGGMGTRAEVENELLLAQIRERAEQASIVLSVCTGAALLARAGVLDGHRATSNKRALGWVREQSDAVEWISRARWVEDGRFVTSSGVTAGIDAAFAVPRRLIGDAVSAHVANAIEYLPMTDPDEDPFAVEPPS